MTAEPVYSIDIVNQLHGLWLGVIMQATVLFAKVWPHPQEATLAPKPKKIELEMLKM